MRSHLFQCVACFLFLALVSSRHPTAPQPSSPTTVTLQSGALGGINFSRAHDDVAFLGVPFAAPPVGTLRWKPPHPVNPWTGMRKATNFGPACPQLPATWFPQIAWNEDCLYLNIWTTQILAASKAPVVVYFHGGSNTAGYSQMTPLGPTLSHLDLVVVSANYRLGPLGFFAHPLLSAESPHHSSGNFGLLDQLQALRWVQENISKFGGDPNRVTVMGQSSGAVDFCLLMSSPLATGLFQQAIMESGDCQSVFNEDIRAPIPYNSISSTGEATGDRLAQDLRIANGPDTLQKLRNIPASEILQAWSKDRQIHFEAIVDGWIIRAQPAKIFAQGKQLHVPVLVGSNADEATAFGHNDIKTIAQYKNYLHDDTGKFVNQEWKAYPAASDAQVPHRYIQLQSDFFAYGAFSMARAMARAGQQAYLYYFTFAETGKRAPLGAYHGEEQYFLTDSFPTDWRHTEDDAALGTAIRAYWSQFAKSANPNSPGLPNWPAYDPSANQSLELGRTIHSRPIVPRVHILDRIMNQIFAETKIP